MSTHVVNIGTEDPDIIINRLQARAAPIVGMGTYSYDSVTGDLTASWPFQLTPTQISQLADIARAAKAELTPNERNGIQSDIDLLVTFQGIASPTLAQTAAATRAQSRILRALLRS